MTTVYYVATLGQSNASSMFNFGNDTDSGASVLASSLSADLQPTGPGSASASALTALVNGTGQSAKFAAANNVVVQNYALGASGVDGNAHGAPPADLTWWYPDTGTPGALAIAAAQGMSQTLASLRAQYDDVRVVVMWGQGEADAKRIADGYSDVDTYKAATMAVFDYVRAAAGQPDAPVYINEIGTAAYQGSEARWNVGQDIVRAAQDDLAAQHDNVYIGAVTQDLPLKDVVHISDDSYEVVGSRVANYIAYTQGLTDVVTGPRPTPDPDNKVDPTDTLPTSNPDVVSVSISTTGNMLANDTDPDGDVLSVVQVSGSGSVKAIYAAGATIQGRFGSLVVSRDGSYAYVLDTSLAAMRALAAGQVGTDIFTYVANDGRGGTASSALSVLVDGQNDAPVAANDTGVAASAVADPLTGNVISGVGGIGADGDPDAGDTISVSLVAAGSNQVVVASSGGSLAGAYGALMLLADGSYRYAIDQANPAVAALLGGQSLTDHFIYTIVDATGLTASASLDIVVQKYPADIAQFGTPTMVGKETADNIGGTADNDIISGAGGNDTLKGNNGNDVVLGGAGDDSIQGNEGNDTIVGGAGRDTVKGGNGSDVFLFTSLSDAGDVIQDLRSIDSINVAQILNLAPGTPGLDAFAFGYLALQQVGADVLLSIDPDGQAGPAGMAVLAKLEATTVGAILAAQFTVSAAGTRAPDPSAPTAVNDRFIVSEDATSSLIGNVVTGAGADLDPSGAELAVVAVNGSMGLVGSWVRLASGARFLVDANGNVQFDTAGKFQSLGEGQTSSQTFSYSIFNDFSSTAFKSTATATVMIAGVNDAPMLAGPLGLSLTAGSPAATLSLLTDATDVDLGDVLSITQISGSGEGLSIEGSTLTIDPTASRFAGLHVGETQTIVIGYDVADLHGASVHQTATITIAGSLPAAPQPPVLGTPPAVTLQEGAAAGALDLLAGSVGASPGSTLFVTNVSGLSSGMQLTGSTLTIDPAAAIFDQLAAGEVRVIALNYTVGDSGGGLANQTAVVTIEGANDLPTVGGALPLSAIEDSGIVAFDLLAGAADIDHNDVLTVLDVGVLPDGTSVDGSSLVVDTSNAAFQVLASGEARTIDVLYRIVDGSGAAVDQVAHLTIEGTNDAPTIASPLELRGSEGGGIKTLDLLLGASDVDHGATLTVDHVEGLSAGVTVTNGVLAVDLDNAAFNGLAQGQTQSLEITYAIVDEYGAAVRTTASLVVEGTNDAPTTTGGLTANTTRGDSPISIDLLASASDVDSGAALEIRDLPTSLPAGFSLDGTRVIIDPSSPAFDGLYDGQSVVQTLTFRVADEFGATVDQTLTVTIAGRGLANAHAVSAPTDIDIGSNHIAENASAGSLVGITARATDADAVNNGVTYSLVNASGEFAIDLHTGVVTVAGAIDFEAGPTRSILVEAASEDGSTARTTFSIAIDDLNEHAPAITTSAWLSVAENSIFVANLTASDADNPGTPASFSITGGSDAGLFAITNGKLAFKTARDYEQDQHSYQVEVSASDGLYTTAKLITISLADVAGVSINGTRGADLIDATHGPAGQPRPTGEEDTLLGLAGNDTLWGLGGNDLLNGGVGADQMNGGSGDDSYYVDSAGDVVIEGLDAGHDTVVSTISYTLGANVEALVLTGSTSQSATGNSAANSIVGNGGNNALNGGLGADTLSGGAGNDTYYVEDAGDRVVEIPGQGTDTVNTTLTSYTLSDNVEKLDYVGNAEFWGVGNATANTILGGSDNDTLDGGLGADTLDGGAGNDTYVLDNAKDAVRELSGNGSDTIVTTLSTYTLGVYVESLAFVGSGEFVGYGNSLANSIVGGDGDDSLDGKAGADTMSGGVGNDIYYVDSAIDRVIEAPGNGFDTTVAKVSWALGANVEALILAGTAALTATGNAAGNTISGNAGSNTIDGGAGRDTLAGGKGVDTFVFRAGDAGGDVVTDFEGARVRGGDVLRFENFGHGWITQNGSSDFYTIHGDASHSITETIQLVGVFNLNLVAGSNGDVLFV